MKIAIFGISCTGKDTFISKLLQSPVFRQVRHIKGSQRLRELSQIHFSKDFEILSEDEKTKLRIALASELKESDNIIVDGHFCFPNDGMYKKAFTKSDLDLYDVFVYLRGDTDTIRKRISESKKNEKFRNLTSEQLKDWQQHEIEEMREDCFCARKDFIILDDDFANEIAFLEKYASNYPKTSSLFIAEKISDFITKNAESKKVALVDCDRTITAEDTTIPFFEMNGVNCGILKHIFSDDLYSSYQFWRQTELYKDFSKYPLAETFHYNQLVLDKVSELKSNGFEVYGFTAGILEIWKRINYSQQFFSAVIGNDLTKNTFGIISDFVKGFVPALLTERGITVYSVGDSMCDIFMLENSLKGLVYAPQKIRPAVQKYIETHKETKIKQFRQNEFQYKGIEKE